MPSILGVLLLGTLTVALPHIVPFPKSVVTSNSCTSNSECPSDSCCVLGPSRYAIPTCRLFQQKGEQCRVNADTVTTNLTYPDNSQIELKGAHFILCSCANGLSCDSKRGICD